MMQDRRKALCPLPPSLRFLPSNSAARSLSNSIDALAKQANLLALGQTIVELDPALVDASFVSDRMGRG